MWNIERVPPLLPRFLEDHQERVEHARKLEQIVRESGANVTEERASRQHVMSPTDLRGLPAIGRGVSGAIAWTQPGR